MTQTENKYALITGASSGIGYELAKVFAENEYNLVLVARSGDELNHIAADFSSQYGVKAIAIAKDLFEKTAASELYEEVISQGVRIDVLVNNAGQGVYGAMIETQLEDQLKVIQLNVVSLT